MVCSPLIWLDNTVLSTTLETLADPVRGLNASPAELQWATGSYALLLALSAVRTPAAAEDLTAREGADVGSR